MKPAALRISGFAWMVLAYAMMIPVILWSLTHRLSDFTTSVFFFSLLTIWVPAYVYANRADIVRNRVFWASQSTALLVACLVMFVIAPWLLDFADASMDIGRQSRTWGGISAGFGSWYAAQSFLIRLASKAFETTEKRVERLMEENSAKSAALRK